MALKRLENWINSWQQPDGSYNGLISTFWQSTNNTIQQNVVHQAPIINPYLNLYHQTNNLTFFNKAINAAQFLIKDFNLETFQYSSSFADTPGKIAGPILNIECDLVLLRLYKEYKQKLENPERYLDTVIQNVDNYLLKKWWDGKIWNHYVANQIAKGGELFLELYHLTNQSKYLNYAIDAGNWLVKNQIKEGKLKGALEQSLFDSRVIIIYEAACLPLLNKIYKQTKDIQYLQARDRLINFLKKCELDQGGFVGFFEQSIYLKIINLFSRKIKLLRPILLSIKKLILNKNLIQKHNPIFIARLGEIVLNLIKAEAKSEFNIEKHVQFIIQNQLASGGIKNCIGNIPSALNHQWIYHAPTFRWNAFAFELLSMINQHSLYSELVEDIPTTTTYIPNYGYLIESQRYFGLLKTKNNKIILERLFIKDKIQPILKDLELGKKKKKNILVVTPSFPPEIGGCSSRISDFVQFLSKDKFNIHLLTNLVSDSLSREITNDATVNRIPLFVSFRSPLKFLNTLIWLWRYILNNKIDTIIVTIPPGLHAIVALLVANILNKKIIVDVRDPWIDGEILAGNIKPGSWKHRLGRYIEKQLYQKSDYITLVYQRLAKQIAEKYKIDKAKMAWIPNGINTDLANQIQSIQNQVKNKRFNNKTIFLYQGLMARPQAAHRILKFVPQILKIVPSAIFLFIGDGESKNQIIKTVHQKNLGDYVIFMGKMSRTEVLCWIAQANYGIATLDDKFKYAIPSKIFDYLIFQKPIIATVPIDGEANRLIQKYQLGINLWQEKFKLLDLINKNNPIFADYSRKYNAQKLADIITNNP